MSQHDAYFMINLGRVRTSDASKQLLKNNIESGAAS
jgi:hypothetical protein